MDITQIEGTQYCKKESVQNIKVVEQEKISKDTAEFFSSGGAVESIPTGLSGNTYSSRPLTAKQAREKLNRAVKHQRRKKN